MTRMKCAPLAAGGLALLALLVTSSARSVVPARHEASARAAQLMAFGGRSVEQRSSPSAAKLDAALADLSRHLHLVRAEHALEDLHSLSPAAHFMQSASSTAP